MSRRRSRPIPCPRAPSRSPAITRRQAVQERGLPRRAHRLRASAELAATGRPACCALRPGVQMDVAPEAQRAGASGRAAARPRGRAGCRRGGCAGGRPGARRAGPSARAAPGSARRTGGTRPTARRAARSKDRRVDEDRAPGAELDVVGARVPEREAGRDGPPLDVEGQERRSLELRRRSTRRDSVMNGERARGG